MRRSFAAVVKAEPGLRLVYWSGLVLGAILTHLASELFALGSDAGGVILSRHHLYLALAALACGIVVICQLRHIVALSHNARDLKRILNNATESLPLGGRWQLYPLTALFQVVIGLGTAVGEGCAFCGHDVSAGVIGAVITAICLAFALGAFSKRLPNIAATIAALFLPLTRAGVLRVQRQRSAWLAPCLVWWSPQLANRPPPRFHHDFVATSPR